MSAPSKKEWILASASPRRRELLQHIGLNFTVLTADTDEQSDERDPSRLVQLLAERKARAVRQQHALSPDTVIIAADTVVVSPTGEILGKPTSVEHARCMLRQLSDATHRVISGIAVLCGDQSATDCEVTEVTFAPLSESLIEQYVASGEPMDKAGGYGIQDTAALFIRGIQGDYFNVVGLPLYRLESLLNRSFGLSLWIAQ